MKFNFDPGNIPDNDGLTISLIGMAIVFLGLLAVSCMIIVLPKALHLLDASRRRKPDASKSKDAHDDMERREKAIVAAIAMVLEDAMRPEDGSTIQRITIRRSGTESIWRQAGQMRSLSSHTPIRGGPR
ncbi:hypothetical protein DDZ13_08535 [Coraliomargarita sinensis]|uniref:Uncharacterized protein n=1 Tax=Coraliomargarita sinensis TaxID=2174842 RepID=A0A317ZF62_9BACT|nr:OadG family protein [Coraliomargarita sinensis]PXA04076.1 hypothetical protein DDZ13_08535 [Coraliomargarita sinensis]